MDEFEDLEDEFESVPADGYGLAFAKTGRHVFCGEHDIVGAHCPNCDLPLVQMMSLDTGDDLLQLDGLGVDRVPLLFCWRCNLAQGETQYVLHVDGGIELIKFRRGDQGDDFPYEDYPRFFPEARFELQPTSGKLEAPKHQVGGWPFLIQQMPPHALCRVCGSAMHFLASVADDATEGGSFAGNSWVQVLFLLCVKDRVVASCHEVD